MTVFRSVFLYSAKRVLRQKTVLFWSLVFPLLLSTLFSLAFSNLNTAELIREPIQLAFVAPQQKNQMYDLHAILAGIPAGEGSDRKLFSIQTTDREQAEQLVLEGKVSAAVLDGETPELLLTKVNLKQVVVKQVLDQVVYTKNTITQLIRINPLAPFTAIATTLNEADFVQQQQLGTGNMQPDVVYYYALLAMTCLGASAAGVTMLLEQQANKSAHGARVAASPANKWLRVAAAALASYLVQWALTLIVLGYMAFVLGKDFGGSLSFLLTLTALGTLMGFLMGVVIACILRGSENVIYGVAIGFYLFSSFLTGLMSVEVKRLIDTSVPWLTRINPGTMIVDALYSLYYYGQADYSYMFRMLAAVVLFAGISSMTLGRRYHDSL